MLLQLEWPEALWLHACLSGFTPFPTLPPITNPTHLWAASSPSIFFQFLPNSLMASMNLACSSAVHFSRTFVMVYGLRARGALGAPS